MERISKVRGSVKYGSDFKCSKVNKWTIETLLYRPRETFEIFLKILANR